MATKITELGAAFETLAAQVGKANDEVLAKLEELEGHLESVELTPEAQASFDKLKAAIQKVDDVIPDAPAPAPTPEPTPAPENPPA